MEDTKKLKERLENIDKLEQGGQVNKETAGALRKQAQEILGKLEGPSPTVETGEVVDKLKSMERKPFLGLKGVNTPEELKPNYAARETQVSGPRPAPVRPPSEQRQKSALEQRMDRENAIMASIMSKAQYSNVLAKPGPGMIKPTDMSRMFGIELPGKVGELSMGIPRNALTDEEMEFLMDRNARMSGGV